MTPAEIIAIRKEMNLRPAALANALAMDRRSYERVEAGLEDLSDQQIWALKYLLEHPDERPEVAFADIRSYGVADAIDAWLESEKLFDGRTWGDWRFDAQYLSLDYQSRMVIVDHDEDGEPIEERREQYSVRLVEITNSRQAIDWIGQIAGKGWGAPAVGYFVEALDDIFHLQDTFVHQEKPRNSTDIAAFLRKRIPDTEKVDLE